MIKKRLMLALASTWLLLASSPLPALLPFDSAQPLSNLFQNDLSHAYARVLRGKTAPDFEKLSDDPNRKIVMLMGPDGLAMLSGKTGDDIMLTLGYEPSYLAYKIEEGNLFKLIVFSPVSPPPLATWDNMLDLVAQVYPAIKSDLIKNKLGLQQTSFKEIEEKAGFSFAEVDKKGKDDPRYMTYERYLSSEHTLTDTRAFLYFTLYLREQFSGDGYTHDNKGQRGLREYIILNQSLQDIDNYLLFNIDVKAVNK